ncbi:MAG: hypothetical protein MUC87_04640 [Bacteroidia bacterium]|jgi:hypothetical protein|nr:hypothetical protein [Bacteroidia bacterium]
MNLPEVIYQSTQNGNVFGLNLQPGEIQWQFENTGKPRNYQPIDILVVWVL